MPGNRQILLRSRPVGMPSLENFEMVERPMPKPGEEEVLTRTLFLSLDPYMRGRMSDAKSYASPVSIGGVMTGQTVDRVVTSRHFGFAAGDLVLGPGEGRVKYREDIVDRLENAPEAFIGLLQGRNFGKLVVRVASE